MPDYSTLKKQILNDLLNDKNVRSNVSSLNTKIKAGKATFTDVSRLAESLSRPTASKLMSNLPSEDIAAYAEEVIAPVYGSAQKTVLSAGRTVQQGMLKRAKLGIEPANVQEDTSRIQHIVGRFREAASSDTVSFLLGPDVAENILKSAVTDTIKGNAREMTDMGFETYVTRSDGAGCCDWCASVCGTFKLDDLPDDFWAVHKGCTCTFEYKSKDTHSRITFSTAENGVRTKTTTNL